MWFRSTEMKVKFQQQMFFNTQLGKLRIISAYALSKISLKYSNCKKLSFLPSKTYIPLSLSIFFWNKPNEPCKRRSMEKTKKRKKERDGRARESGSPSS